MTRSFDYSDYYDYLPSNAPYFNIRFGNEKSRFPHLPLTSLTCCPFARSWARSMGQTENSP
ncbi:MAG: hypothetical protein ACRD4L_02390, partial [Pyrinomonadaceae bacterium]